MLGAEGFNELDVLLLTASLYQDAEVCLSSVKSLGALSQSPSKTIVNEGLFEDLEMTKALVSSTIHVPFLQTLPPTHLLQGILDAHSASLCRGCFRLLDLFDFTDIGGCLFNVGHGGLMKLTRWV